MLARAQPSRFTRILLILSLVVASGAGVWQYHRAAMAAFDRAAGAQARPWLQPARPLISLTDWFRLPWLDNGAVAQLLGAKAIGKMAEDPLSIAGLGGARHAVNIFNRMRLGCEIVASRQRISACSTAQESGRLRRIDDNFEQSTAGRDFYARLGQDWLTIAPKIAFSSAVCNLYPGQASTDLAVRYHPSDRLGNQRFARELAPGECVTAFSRKLRHAPTISASASAAGFYGGDSTGSQIAWNHAVVIADAAPNAVWGLRDPALCHTSASAVCGGQQIDNPLAYARALAQSRENDAAYRRLMPDGVQMFTIGLATADAARRDEFGPYIDYVDAGGPAAAAGLRSGDRIVGINDMVIYTGRDIAIALDRHGLRHRLEAPLAIQVLRNGEVWSAQVPLLYNRYFWDRLGYNGWWAALRGAGRALTFGFDGRIRCSALGQSLIPVDRRYAGECLARYELTIDALRTIYSFGFNAGAFLASAISPLHILLRRIVPVLEFIGNDIIRASLHGAAVAVIDDVIVTIASTPPERMSGLMRRIQTSAPQAAVMGALTPGL
jgi:hypothetical protein